MQKIFLGLAVLEQNFYNRTELRGFPVKKGEI